MNRASPPGHREAAAEPRSPGTAAPRDPASREVPGAAGPPGVAETQRDPWLGQEAPGLRPRWLPVQGSGSRCCIRSTPWKGTGAKMGWVTSCKLENIFLFSSMALPGTVHRPLSSSGHVVSAASRWRCHTSAGSSCAASPRPWGSLRRSLVPSPPCPALPALLPLAAAARRVPLSARRRGLVAHALAPVCSVCRVLLPCAPDVGAAAQWHPWVCQRVVFKPVLADVGL